MVIRDIYFIRPGILFVAWLGVVGGCDCAGRTAQKMVPSAVDSPRALVSYLHSAMDNRDYAKVLHVIAPSEKARHVHYFKIVEGYHADWDRLTAAIRKRFGENTAMEQAIARAQWLSPLRNNLEDGAISWDSLQFTQAANDPGRLCLQDLSGHTIVELIKVDRRWFVISFDGGSCAIEYMGVLAKQVAHFRDGIERLLRVVQNGPATEVERRVYEALGQSRPGSTGKAPGRGTSSHPTRKRNPDPLLDG